MLLLDVHLLKVHDELSRCSFVWLEATESPRWNPTLQFCHCPCSILSLSMFELNFLSLFFAVDSSTILAFSFHLILAWTSGTKLWPKTLFDIFQIQKIIKYWNSLPFGSWFCFRTAILANCTFTYDRLRSTMYKKTSAFAVPSKFPNPPSQTFVCTALPMRSRIFSRSSSTMQSSWSPQNSSHNDASSWLLTHILCAHATWPVQLNLKLGSRTTDPSHICVMVTRGTSVITF